MKKAISSLIRSRSYVLILISVAIAAYSYGILHSAIDIDDTAIPLYFQQGLAPYVHRWTLFVFFRIFHIAAAFKHTALVDGFSIVMLCISVTLWCGLWKWILDRFTVLPTYIYGIIAAVFISNPIISEVFIYFLHNGICISYGLTAISLYSFLRSTASHSSGKIIPLLISVLTLSFSVGCYESFLLVFVMGAFLIFLAVRGLMPERCDDDRFISNDLLSWILSGSIVIGGVLIIRALMYRLCLTMYDANAFAEYDVTYRSFFGDNLTALSELGMTLKRYISLYHINGMMYLPVAILIISRITILILGLFLAIKRKKFSLLIATLIIYILPPFMAVLEGSVTKYRSAQYVPMLSSYALLLTTALMFKYINGNKKICLYMIVMLQAALVIFQSLNMNKWFYGNYRKYEYFRETLVRIANDLENGNYDISKPLVFVGACKVPADITAYGSIPFESRRFRMICTLTDPVDPHWKEKFYSIIPGLGYIYNASPQESILQWGTDAFNHTDEQIIKLLEMLGYEGFNAADTRTIEEGNQLQNELCIPSIFSGEEYIYEAEDFLLVNIEAN